MPANVICLAAEKRTFYHGTSKACADSILHTGFRGWSWTSDHHVSSYLAKQNADRYKHGGIFGTGTYVSRDWRVSLFFGTVLFRVELQPSTRILDLDVPPDPKIINRLKREFGHEILHKNPRKVMPHNKRLTLEESVHLARHHVKLRLDSEPDMDAWQFHQDRLMEVRPILMRFGIHGWGVANDLNGIAIFNTDHIKPREVVVSITSQTLIDACYHYERTDGPHASINAMIQTMNLSNSPEAHDNRRWLQEANRILAARTTEYH